MAQYVSKSIESVLKQTLSDFELIVVNDGSTDNSLDIIESFARKDKRITVINKKNAGLASAYNAGQEKAKGKYIYFLDSDDWIEPNCLQELCAVAEKYAVEVVKAAGVITKEKGRNCTHVMISEVFFNHVLTNMLEFPEFVSRHVAQWSCLYRRDFLLLNDIWCPEYPAKMAPDIDFMYHVWIKCKRLFVLPKAFVHYRLNNTNSDKNSGAKMSFYLLRGHLVARGTLAKIHPPKEYWFVKTKVEFQHFLYELESDRCATNRLTYLRGISKIFRENLKHQLVRLKTFTPAERMKYKLIAYLPKIYWLNSALKFWTTTRKKAEPVIRWRFFGLYRCVELKQIDKIYFLTLPIKEKTRRTYVPKISN